MVVEITPIGIQNLGWQFYIVWTVFNASFVPIVYFLYPETAGRSLEDIDDYYRTDPPLLVFRDKDAISTKRPEKYRIREEEEVRRHSSVDRETFRRQSRIGSYQAGMGRNDNTLRHREAEEDYEGKTESGDMEQDRYHHKEDV